MTMTAEELTSQITILGEKIKQAKAENQPKETWDEFLQSMLQLKVCVRTRQRSSDGIDLIGCALAFLLRVR